MHHQNFERILHVADFGENAPDPLYRQFYGVNWAKRAVEASFAKEWLIFLELIS